jgi:hypothetical protein
MQAQSATGPVEIGEASPLIDDDAGDDRLGTTLTGDVPAPPGDKAPEHGGFSYGGAHPIERRLRRALAAPAVEPAAQPEQAAASEVSLQAAALGVSQPPASLAADAAVIERLNAGLNEWVDEAKARPYSDSPSDLLNAVAKHRRRVIPDEFTKTLELSLLEDQAVFDEAALLYDRLHRPTSPNAPGVSPSARAPVEPTTLPTLPTLRATFLAALRVDYPKRRALDALFVPSSALGQTAPYFDGFSLRNAEGKSFDDLLERQDVWASPAHATLTPAERRTLLARKFDEMGESTQFAIGSIEHSMATALLRIDRYGGRDAPAVQRTEAELVKAFVTCDRAWKKGDAYPYPPRLLFAAHLARSSGFEVISPEQLRLIYENQVKGPALDLMADGDVKPADWLGRHLAGWGPGGGWRSNPVRQTEALLWLFRALSDVADKDDPVAAFARDIKAKGVLTPNRFVGVDPRARAAVTLEYANERLTLAYGNPPSFDRREVANALLRRAGVDDPTLTDMRHYVIAGDNPNVTKHGFGDIVDEFLERADWVGLNGSSMTLPNAKWIKPREELEREETAFNARLLTDPWVVAAAKERLRAQSKAVTPDAVRQTVSDIAGNLAAETESHRALVKGLETWVNTVPVVGPVYNIEEGVRHRDAARAAFGLLFLGIDLFDVTTGAGGGQRSAATHPIVPKLRRAVGRIDASRFNVAGHPDLIDVGADPVRIGQPDANVPVELREFARRARENRFVRWSDYDLVHFDLEDRIVPVSREGDNYFEVDWRTRRVLRDGPVIERDSVTGKGRVRDEVHPQLDARLERGADMQEHLTVKGVTALLEQANDTALRNFDELFADAFVHQAPPANSSGFDAPAFYRKVYDSSDTFRRLFNRHAQIDARARNSTAQAGKKWEFMIGEAAPLGAPRKAYTDFEHKRIYMPCDADIEAMPYVSTLGPATASREQAYLHEMIHALTGGRDPKPESDLLNRGPVVYLTDKILAEAGYDIPEQIMYRRRDSTSDVPSDETIDYHASDVARRAAAENRYLDKILDAQRGVVTADTIVQGVPVSSRLTVERTRAAIEAIEGTEDDVFLAWGDFKTKFDRNFGFYFQNRVMTEQFASDARVITELYGRLYQRSATFRRMFDEMPPIDVAQADPWKFMLEGDIDFQALSPRGRAHGVAETAKKIYVLDDGMRYLSEAGLREVEIERKLAYQMICAMTGLGKVPAPQVYANRGAAVYLTDRILKEAGFNYPQQLVAALAGPSDAAAQAQLLAQQSAAMRSAWVEDRYLSLVA